MSIGMDILQQISSSDIDFYIGLVFVIDDLIIVAIILTVINIGISIYRMITAPGPPDPPVPPPGEVDSIPAAEQGHAVPVLFGTRIIAQPNVVYWGNPSNKPIKKTSAEISANA
jgi:hypothetical protein